MSVVRPLARPLRLVALALVVAGCARGTRPVPPAESVHQFTFAWPFRDGDAMRPRGGTTQGPEVQLATEPSAEWRRLREPGLSDFERDRRAILAMAGGFRTSFDFLEVVGLVPGFTPDRPYQSWATELVRVVEDRGTLIRLQHVLVMTFRTADGATEGPVVVRHFRQDWRYEDTELLVYRGRNTWERERRPKRAVRGTWTEAVFQVDDSPRYEAVGRWRHFGNASSWESETTWRPLPRREFSVRKDYDVLVGTNRHTITPTGWVQFEDNRKVALADVGTSRAADPVLAEEVGVARYERVVGVDWSAGERYLERTEPFWTEVRAAWDEIARAAPRFTLRAPPDQGQLFQALFAYADRLADGAPYDPADGARVARTEVRGYLAREGPAAAPSY
jgi:hypothetical protein